MERGTRQPGGDGGACAAEQPAARAARIPGHGVELDEEAAARIETIWKELARDGDVEDDIIADEEASVAGGEVEAAVADSVVGSAR